MVPADACRLDATRLPPHARIYLKDHDASADGPPPAFAGLSLRGDEVGWVERCGHRHFFGAAAAPDPALTVQQLFRRLPAAEALGLPEGERVR